MILPAVFFSIIFSLDYKATAYVSCEDQCPRDGRTYDRYECNSVDTRSFLKDYDMIFSDINTLQLSGSGKCIDPEGCIYCDCYETSVREGQSGLTGQYCETKFERCPDGKQVCFNGAHCLQVAESDEYICACAYIEDEKTYMGEHCEYEANDVCESAGSLDRSVYCTNNGRCNNGLSSSGDSCLCMEGFFGLHCEFLEEPLCELDCKNGGICNRGIEYVSIDDDDINKPRFTDDDAQITDSVKRYNEHDDDDFYRVESASYCVCPKGWSGEICQYKETDDGDCDDSICMNGSLCQVDPSNEEGEFYCDCSNAVNEEGDKVPHAGLKCERIYTDMCTGSDGYTDPEFYCTNGGTCPSDIHLPCTCLDRFSGPRCEFHATATKECPLPCENGGSCFFGNKPDDISGSYGKSEMHCKCPDTFTGFLCEIIVDICASGEHHCFNNGKCVKDGEDHSCDCDSAITDSIHAGEHCEHIATSYCQGSGANVKSFCTNHGTCKEMIDISESTVHPGCDCTSPFYGDYCEKGATLMTTMQTYCDGPGGFTCYNHGQCKELKLNTGDTGHPGCVCEAPYFGDLCQFRGNTSKGNGTARKIFAGFTISIFLLLAIFFLVVAWRKRDYTRNIDRHTPIGVPPEVHVHAVDLDITNNINTEIMGTGYEDEDEKEVLENVYIS